MRDVLRNYNAYGPDDAFPLEVSLPFPSTPWDDEFWVVKRDDVVRKHMVWLANNSLLPGFHYRVWFDKVDAVILYYFKDNNKALLFKLACGGNV